jgi:hypothetical protein
MKLRIAIKIISNILIISVLTGCIGGDIDIFGTDRRNIIGDFALFRCEEWEKGGVGFFLDDRTKPWSGTGVLNGTVRELGWNKRYILAWQNPDNGISGWFVVDLKTKIIQGPIADNILKIYSRIQHIHVFSAEEAWRRLK